MVEAESKEICDRYAGEIVAVIKANGHAVD
jgi:hypothetical protein